MRILLTTLIAAGCIAIVVGASNLLVADQSSADFKAQLTRARAEANVCLMKLEEYSKAPFDGPVSNREMMECVEGGQMSIDDLRRAEGRDPILGRH